MKTFQELKDFMAKDQGYESWEAFVDRNGKWSVDEVLSQLAEIYRISSHVAEKYKQSSGQAIVNNDAKQAQFTAAVEEINNRIWSPMSYEHYLRYKSLKDTITLGMSFYGLSVSPIVRPEPEWIKFQPG